MKIAWPMVLACLAFASTAPADTIYFDDQATFEAAFEGLALESFESLPAANDFTADGFILPDFTVGPINPTYSPSMGVWNGPAFGGHAMHGVKWIGYQAGEPGEVLRFAFDTPILAFGLWITDWGDSAGESDTLVFSNDNGDNHTVASGPFPDGHERFFGVITEIPFSTVNLTNSVDGEFYGFDAVFSGVPEPTALVLVLLGTALQRRS